MYTGREGTRGVGGCLYQEDLRTEISLQGVPGTVCGLRGVPGVVCGLEATLAVAQVVVEGALVPVPVAVDQQALPVTTAEWGLMRWRWEYAPVEPR